MILVTGGTSQVGMVLVRQLAENGEKVRCLVRKNSKTDEIKLKGVEIFIGDVDDEASIEASMEGVEYVVHIAGIWRSINLIRACEQAKKIKRVIFIGSTSRFKKLESIDKQERQLAERMAIAEEEIANSSLKTVILRPTMLYGIDRDKNILQIISFMERFRFYPILGNGKALRHPVYVGDVVHAIILCLKNDHVICKDYVIAGKDPIRYNYMLKAIKKSIGKRIFLMPLPLFAGYAAVLLYRLLRPSTYINYAMVKRLEENMYYDIAPAVRDFGYQPLSFEEGVERQVAYLRAKGIIE